jgi:hypothetical protein
MKRRAFLAGIAGTLVAAPAGAVPFHLPQVEYAADRYVRQGDRFQNMRVHYAPGMERLELQGSAAAGNVLILRHDLGRAFLVMPRMRALAELPHDVLARLGQAIEGTDLQPIGTEAVNGITAVKNRATGSFTGLVWLTRSGIPLKIDGQRKTTDGPRRLFLEQRNISPGAQPASLFEVPAGMTRIQLTDPAWLGLLGDIIG